DLLALRAELLRAPLRGEALAQLDVTVGGVEDAADDELRRGCPIPGVLLEPEGDVVVAGAPETVELRTEPERNRRARNPSRRLADPEPQMLAVTDGGQVAHLAGGDEQVHAGVAEAEGGEPTQLRAEAEGEGGARDDRVDDRHRPQIVVAEVSVGML